MDRFEKSLKKTDVTQKLAVPTEFVTSNDLVNGAELVTTDFSTSLEKSYTFELSIRESDYTKPVFQYKAWQQFVKDNCLREDDIIEFWKVDNERYGIRATRKYL